ncbi:MAG TPA: glycosyltransferase family 39 protein [Planctomycetota bacterium]
MAKTRTHEVLDALLIAGFFVIAVVLVSPHGEFPINDDWDYQATVADLIEHGEMRLSDWPAMSLVGQIAWGAAFAKVLGLSYHTLRLSTLALALLGSLALYGWSRAIGRGRAEAVFVALLFASSPLVFALSCTFMTDVPGAALMLVVMFAQAAYARRGGAGWALAAGLAASLAYLFRQTAALPVLVLAGTLLVPVILRRARAIELVVLMAPLVIAIAGFNGWLDRVNGRPFNASFWRFDLIESMFVPELRAIMIPTILPRVLSHAINLGVFVAPLVLGLAATRAGRLLWASRLARITAAIVTIAATVPLVAGMEIAPLRGSHAGDLYLGFETVYRELCGPELLIGSLSITVISVLTLIGIVSLGLLAGLAAASMRDALRTRRERPWLPFSPAAQAGSCALLLFGLIVVQRNDFDRYDVPVVPMAAMFVLAMAPRGSGALRAPAAWVMLLIVALMSIVGTQDYFARGRARWQAREQLLRSGLPPQWINAGFEHAALWCFAPHYRRELRVRPYLLDLPLHERAARQSAEDPSHLWMDPRAYKTGYTVPPGAEVVATAPWRAWLRSGTVYAFRSDRSPWSMFHTVPFQTTGHLEPMDVDGQRVLFAHPPSELCFRLTVGVNVVSGAFGILPGAWQGEGNTDGVTFHVVRETGSERSEVLRRLLQPLDRSDDRGTQRFSVTVEAAAGSVLVLTTDCGPNGRGEYDWSYWTRVRIEPR